MVFIPDSDVINIDEGTVKSEQFHDGKGASKRCLQLMVCINNIYIFSISHYNLKMDFQHSTQIYAM